jgi:hypothetical protein
MIARQEGNPFLQEDQMYEAPTLEVFGTFRDLTLNGGTPSPSDISPYHRYGG